MSAPAFLSPQLLWLPPHGGFQGGLQMVQSCAPYARTSSHLRARAMHISQRVHTCAHRRVKGRCRMGFCQPCVRHITQLYLRHVLWQALRRAHGTQARCCACLRAKRLQQRSQPIKARHTQCVGRKPPTLTGLGGLSGAPFPPQSTIAQRADAGSSVAWWRGGVQQRRRC